MDGVNLDELKANYSVGEPMTWEQMTATKQSEREFLVTNPFADSTETNPYVFDDAPVGYRRFALLNVVGPGMAQQHEQGLTMLKVKATTLTCEQARRLAATHQAKDPKYHIYVNEMFKFTVLPPPKDAVRDVDAAMNEAIKGEYAAMEDRNKEFLGRKSTMISDLERQNDLTRKIASGEADADEADSTCVCPEPAQEAPALNNDMTEDMEPDAPSGVDRFIVLATLEITREGPLQGSVIVKLCGSFENEEAASSHMKSLKKSTRYKLFDVSVCDMYAWLRIPPPYELMDHVVYDSDKLTEALGARKQVIDVHDKGLQEPADDLGGTLV